MHGARSKKAWGIETEGAEANGGWAAAESPNAKYQMASLIEEGLFRQEKFEEK